MIPPSSISSIFFLIFSVIFILINATAAEATQHQHHPRRGGVQSQPDQNHGVTCEDSAGNLDYYDCLKTIWSLPVGRDQSSYKGDWMLFPPAETDCAIAIFPFPVPGGGRPDFTSWNRLRTGANKIASECQRGRQPSIGGYDYGFGVNGNTAIVLFKLAHPSDTPANHVAYLPRHSWDTLYHYMHALVYPDQEPVDENQAGSSSGVGSSAHNAEILSLVLPEWYDPNGPLPTVDSESNSVSALVAQQHSSSSSQLANYPGGPAAMLAFEQEHAGQSSSGGGTCPSGYCLSATDCGGCGDCFRIANEKAMSILLGIAHFFTSLGRCLPGPESIGSGPSSRKRSTR